MGSASDQWAATAALLAGVSRVRLGHVTRAGGGYQVEYRGRDERPLTERLPGKPAAVRVYGHDGACAAIFLDLDSSRGGADAVTREARKVTKFLLECGARVIEDVSPNGGRHLYVPLAERLDLTAARELVEALALRFPTIDASPHRSARSGCIRTPGSRHKSGGHQQLVTPLAAAVDVLRARNGADVVLSLRIRLAPQIAAWHASQQPQTPSPGAVPAPVDDIAPPGRRRALSPAIARIAREGIYDAPRYPSPSEARMAVMTAAARAGWALTDVVVRLEDGRWPGLAGMYEASRPQDGPRRDRIAGDWRKARQLVARTKRSTPDQGGVRHARRSDTSLPESLAGGLRAGLERGSVDHDEERRFIRSWTTTVFAVELHRLAGMGTRIRWMTRALAEAAQKSGSRYVGFGSRSLGVAIGASHETAAVLLKLLMEAGWLDRIESAKGTTADLYELTVPADLREAAATLRWHAGRVHAKRPAFRELGDPAGLVFEAIELDRGRTVTTLVAATGLARSSVADAVDILGAYGLVERVDGALVAHVDRLARVGEDLGAAEAVAAQISEYARQRRIWHAYLARHDLDSSPLTVSDLYDPDVDEYWLPPPDDPTWTMTSALVAS